MLLGGTQQPTKRYSDNFDAQYINDVEFSGKLIAHTMLEEAWTLMNTLKPESIPLLMNKAICLFEMNRNEDCLKACERSLALLGTMKNTLPTPPPDDMRELHEVQKNQVTYLNPVTFRYVELFPEILRDSALRIQVDCWSALGNTAKVIEVGTPMLGKGYRNVMEAFYKIDHPDPTPPATAGYGVDEHGKVYFQFNGERR